MALPDDQPTRRREFLGQMAASAVVLAGVACTTPLTTAQTTPAPMPAPPRTPPAPIHWDDSWFGRLTAKHKAVFDSPELEYADAADQAIRYIQGMRAAVAAGDNDVQTVIVIRHAAMPLALNDAMWAKYQLGKELKIKDDETEKWVTRNPFATSGDGKPSSDRPQPTLAWLNSHGHILLGCNLALHGQAWLIGKRVKADPDAVYDELKENLVPGVILQPNGVYAVHRAQEAGCTYIKAT